MKDETNGYLGFAIFFLIIIAIVVLGSYFLYKSPRKIESTNKTPDSKINENAKEKIKTDKNKDLIYFENEEVISENLGISFKDVVININNSTASEISKNLNEETTKLKKEVIKSDDEENSCTLSDDDLFETKVRDYAILENDYYITLVVNDSSYNCNSSFGIITKLKSYTFNLATGELYLKDKLLKEYNLSDDEVKEKIMEHLENKSDNQINIDKTINNLNYNENYSLYINEDNKLELKYIVKTDTKDYNDTIILN